MRDALGLSGDDDSLSPRACRMHSAFPKRRVARSPAHVLLAGRGSIALAARYFFLIVCVHKEVALPPDAQDIG